jgi:CHAT domain-containing protein
MVGNPTFYTSANGSASIGQLPGTEIEVQQLTTLLSNSGWYTDTYIEEQATEEKIKQLNNPKVFHIATHGFFTPKQSVESGKEALGSIETQSTQNPLLRTGLMLSGAGDIFDVTDYNLNIENGILTAYEAMNLNLDNTELVVLSACKTGLGDLSVGEGVYGLQRAFIVAGAKTLIMSMFKVNDEATQKLMVLFYEKWLQTGNKRQAFVDAKKELRNEFKEPIYWGAFIMIGLD